MEIIKLRGIEFKESELNDYYFNKNKKYIIKYKTIYQLDYSNNANFKTLEIFKSKEKLPLSKAGRHYVVNGKTVNDLLGIKLVTEN